MFLQQCKIQKQQNLQLNIHEFETDIFIIKIKNFDLQIQPPPQISVTDVLGGKVTLVGCSPSTSSESLEEGFSHYSNIPRFLISEPYDSQRPSITRGIGRPLNTSIQTEVEVTLPDTIRRLKKDILGEVKQRIVESNRIAPSNEFIFLQHDMDGSGLSLEHRDGVQIELRICESEENEVKGIKMRRISGDQLQYSQLCQQLISYITV